MSGYWDTQSAVTRRWRLLLVYNLYRLIIIATFAVIFIYNPPRYFHPIHSFVLLASYLLYALLAMGVCLKRSLSFDTQVLLTGTIDIIYIAMILSIMGTLQSGFGISLNIVIAALSILAPGRLAIFFAALASCLLISGSIVQYAVEGSRAFNSMFYSGIYGAGFFATALTAWYLANWVRSSENLARQRSYQLAELQRINEYIVGRLHSGVIYINQQQEIKLMNDAARSFFSLPKAGLVHSVRDLSPALSQKCDQFLDRAKKREKSAQTALEALNLRIHFFATDLGDDLAVLIVLDDLSLVTQQAQQLKLASLGRFSASIAHELRNPLGAIAHAAQLLGGEEPIGKDDQRLKQLIENNCQRMNQVIKNVLQLSRREQSKPESIALASFLRKFKKEFSLHNGCDIQIKPAVASELTIVFDKSQLEQVLVILCENAIQHGVNAAGTVAITITVTADHEQIMIQIKDDGKGIAAETRESIFEPFFTTLNTGTGMGLFIARDLCEINQARLLLLDSEIGACFAILTHTPNELLL